jgi:CRISPR system Cascade subunit CasE
VDFEGTIEITDPGIFVEALFTGIGPAKAFGCGLMLVRRV